MYVAADHLCWSDEDFTRKVRKNRFGRVVESSEEGLNRMLGKHLKESTAWLGEMVGLDVEDVVDEKVAVVDDDISRTFGQMLPGRSEASQFVQTQE